MVQNLKLATAHLSRRLGAGALGRAGVGAGLSTGLGVQARRQQAWKQALGRAGTAQACADGCGARGRVRGARTSAQGAAGEVRGRQGTDERGRAAGCGRSTRQAGARRARRTVWARGARGLGVLGLTWSTGWASLGLIQPVWVLTWVFDSVVFLSHRLDSVLEHCS